MIRMALWPGQYVSPLLQPSLGKNIQELLAYHATVIIEALRFNGKGWLPYDKMFRENVAKHPDSDWSSINPMFYSLTFLNQKVEARTCTKCMGPDHSLHECALNSLDQPQLLTPHSTPSESYSRVQEPRFRQQQSVPRLPPPRKRAKREVTPNPSPGSNRRVSVSPGMRASVQDTRRSVPGVTNVLGVGVSTS